MRSTSYPAGVCTYYPGVCTYYPGVCTYYPGVCTYYPGVCTYYPGVCTYYPGVCTYYPGVCTYYPGVYTYYPGVCTIPGTYYASSTVHSYNIRTNNMISGIIITKQFSLNIQLQHLGLLAHAWICTYTYTRHHMSDYNMGNIY